jgi:hypothetical protein
LRICRERLELLSAKKEPRLHGRNEADQNKIGSRFLSVELRSPFDFEAERPLVARLPVLFAAAFSPTFSGTRFAALFAATSSTFLPTTLI